MPPDSDFTSEQPGQPQPHDAITTSRHNRFELAAKLDSEQTLTRLVSLSGIVWQTVGTLLLIGYTASNEHCVPAAYVMHGMLSLLQRGEFLKPGLLIPAATKLLV